MENICMLAEADTLDNLEVYDEDNWIFEQKYDGTRILAVVSDGEVYLVNRRGLVKNKEFKNIARSIELNLAFVEGNTILDGEVVADSFSNLHKNRDKAVYMVFDMLEYAGKDLTSYPLRERKRIMRDKLGSAFWKSKYVKLVEPMLRDDLKEMTESGGIEGIVAKRKESKYVKKRSSEWVKFKKTNTDDFKVIGYEKSDKVGLGALILDVNGTERKVGSGFTNKLRTELLEKLSKGVTRVDGDKVYVDTDMVAEVKWNESNELKYRSPVLIRVRDDKEVKENDI